MPFHSHWEIPVAFSNAAEGTSELRVLFAPQFAIMFVLLPFLLQHKGELLLQHQAQPTQQTLHCMLHFRVASLFAHTLSQIRDLLT